jgi:von Willebrand factor type A domain
MRYLLLLCALGCTRPNPMELYPWCMPRSCVDAVCGDVDDGCGEVLHCGPCGSSTGGTTSGTSGGTTSGTSGGTTSGTSGGTTSGTGGTGGTTGGDPNCGVGVQEFMLQKGLPPDLLIVLDRSGSMDTDPGNGMGTKWAQVTTAINQVVSALQGQIRWGLEVFPHDNDCGVSTSVDVPIAANNASAISGAISVLSPNGSTPTTAAIQAGTSYLQSVSGSNPKYILLATDGEPNCSAGTATGTCMCPAPTVEMNGQCCLTGMCIPCPSSTPGGPDDAAAEKAVSDAATAGVHTFVVGIAADSTADAVLDVMAANGGEARPATPRYFPVTSTADLVNAINAIAGQIVSCNFALQMAPARPDQVSVEVNGNPVPHDASHSSGWDYGPGNLSIQFYGSSCTMLQAGNVTDVKAIFGCG